MEKRRASFGFTVRTNTNPAAISSPTFTPSPPPSKLRRHFNLPQQRAYDFEAPQFYDFTKQSDPERVVHDEHWFDCKKKTPSTPDFNFAARSSSSLTATTGKHSHFLKHSSFMNTPLGNLHAFEGFNSSTTMSRGLKRSASTPNVSLNARQQPLGSDEKKIISGFMNTPVMVSKTPLVTKTVNRGSPLPRTQTKAQLQMQMNLFPSESDLPPSYVRETSSLELLLDSSTFVEANTTTAEADEKLVDSINHKEISDSVILTEEQNYHVEEPIENEPNSESVQEPVEEVSTPDVQETPQKSSFEQAAPSALVQTPVRPASPEVPIISLSLSPFLPHPPAPLSSTLQAADSMIRQLAMKRAANERVENDVFQQSLRAKARADQERIEALAAVNARRLQKLKAGPTVLPAKSTKPLTVPEEFRFEYESRAQLKKMAKPAQGSTENLRPSAMNVIKPRFPSIGKGK